MPRRIPHLSLSASRIGFVGAALVLVGFGGGVVNGVNENFSEYLGTANIQAPVGDPRHVFRLSQGPPPIRYAAQADGSVPFVGSNFSARNIDWYDFAGMYSFVAELQEKGLVGPDRTDGIDFRRGSAEAASLIVTLPDSIEKADAYTDMAIAMVGDRVRQSIYHPEAARYLQESERIHRALNNPAGLAVALGRQAGVGVLAGDDPLAVSRLDEAERLALELGDERMLSRLAGIRVLRAIQEGDLAARSHRRGAAAVALPRF